MSKPIVSIVKIKDNDVEKAVREAVLLAGDIPPKDDNSPPILIKPNALTSKKTWEEQQAVTTDPEVVRSLIKIFKEKGYSLSVGDSSGAGTKTESVLKKAGFKDLEDEGVKVQSLSSGAEPISFPNALKLTDFSLSTVVTESLLVNVPKMKTHTLTGVTLAVKNLYGCLPGMEKTRVHGVGHTAKGFSECLIDIYSVLKNRIVINVMDARICMEGMGPSGGKAKVMDLILASTDAIALDAVATAVMGLKPRSILTNYIAEKHKIGEIDLRNIDVRGESIDAVKSRFSTPMKFVKFLPIGKFWHLTMKQPEYVGDGCIACMRCQNICPVHAIEVHNGPNRPVFDYKLCISCLSCEELCPEDVIKSTHWKYLKFLNLFKRKKPSVN